MSANAVARIVAGAGRDGSAGSAGASSIRVLQVHAFYQQPGGEDAVLAAEQRLFDQKGHYVAQYTIRNDVIRGISGVSAGIKTVWNRDTVRELEEVVRQHNPDVIHAHNTFPLISPALYYAAWRLGRPVIQTLHNYRLLCSAAIFYRDGKICEDCLHASPVAAIVHGCYRNSRLASAAVASKIAVHNVAGTWRKKVSTYVALTQFAKKKFIEGGLPAAKVVVKPNFLAVDPEIGTGDGGYMLFVGRLAPEKGLVTLVKAWSSFRIPIRLKIVGDGPLLGQVKELAAGQPNIEVLGSRTRVDVLRLMQSASALVFPSEWYEGLPMTIIEALACGTPVIASDLNSLDDLVHDGENGTRFKVGSPESLASAVSRFLSKPDEFPRLRANCRAFYLERFTAESNYTQMLDIYAQALREYKTEASKLCKRP